MAKITICGFALVGMIACSSGGSGGSSTSNNGTELVISNPSSVDVAENTTEVLSLTTTGGNGNAVTYTLDDTNDASLFDLSVDVLSFKVAPDFENPDCGDASNTCTINVTASDGVNTAIQTISVTVTNVNDNSPQITSTNSASVQENITAVLTLEVNDDDGDTLTYTLGSNNDESLFTINGNALSFSTAPDSENPACSSNICTVIITASDGVNETTQTITITVTNVNESPQFTSDDSANTPENTTAVLTFAATDDEGDTITYALGSDNDASLFTISGNILSFKTAPDYESPTCSDNSCIVSIIASDSVNNTTQTITVTVTNVNDNSPQITSVDSATVPEKSTAVLSLTADDADGDGDTITYTLGSNNDETLFTISANTNILSFSTAPDYEIPACSDNSCTVSVVAFDGVNSSTTQTITIIVVADSDGDGTPNSTDDDDDNDGELDTDDVDDDNDGLIEIHNLDMLHHIRYNLAGTDYKSTSGGSGNTTGAPDAVTTTCSDASKNTNLCGYELSGDLDFDSSSSYAVNSTNFVAGGSTTSFNANNSDRASATNVGWQPIGDFSNRFSGVLAGNHYAITNLYLNRTDPYLGLFGYMSNGTIRNLGLLAGFIQANTPANNNLNAGMLVGRILGVTTITNSYATGTIADSLTGEISTESIGGLIGTYHSGTHSLRHSYAAVDIDTTYTATDGAGGTGGLVGRNGGGASLEISDSYASGIVSANAGSIGGFVGRLVAIDKTDRNYSIGKLTNTSGEAGFFTSNGGGDYTNNFYDSDIVHAIGGSTTDQPSGVSPLPTAEMQSACTAAQITSKTGICALGNAFQYGNNSYPKLYRLNPDGVTISNTLLGGQD